MTLAAHLSRLRAGPRAQRRWQESAVPQGGVPTPEALPPQDRNYRLKSQIKSVRTWHYIFAECLARPNNINALRPAERPSLLKISLTACRPAVAVDEHSQDHL